MPSITKTRAMAVKNSCHIVNFHKKTGNDPV